jgi:hypothetical protein
MRNPIPTGIIGAVALAVFGLDYLEIIPPGFTYSMLIMLFIAATVNFALYLRGSDETD